MRMLLRTALPLATLLLASPALADTTPQALPFTQDWSNAGLITANDNWSGVPGIIGYNGAGLGTSMLLAPGTMVPQVFANQTTTTGTAGGVGEFDGLTDHVVGLQGSGSADSPHIVITIVTTGATNIRITYDVRDIDGSNTDNSVQPVYLQYRVGTTGNYTDIPAGFVMDATTGPMMATMVTPVSAMLPAAAENQPVVQIRILTHDASGADEWVGIDDISISAVSLNCGNSTVDAGEACDTGPSNGTTTCGCTTSCQFAATTVACGGALSGACDAQDRCDGAGGCAARVAVAGTVCNPSMGACDPAETCDGTTTACPTPMLAAMGTTCGAANGPCDPADTCNGTSPTCPANVATDGTPCTDDGLMCNGAEVCMAGACAHGTPPSCADTDACTMDACVEATPMCTHTMRTGCCNVAADCDDGDACTTDACTMAGGACTYDPVPNCCNAASDCDDGDACTTDSCDTAAHTCGHAPSCVDAGSDAGAATDAGRDAGAADGSTGDASSGGSDAGTMAPRRGGCACTTVGARGGFGGLAAIGLTLALIARRRRAAARARFSSR